MRHAVPQPAASSPSAQPGEWLRTDGTGGYACGTANDLATRRYHGLWVARAGDGARRQLVVAGLDERLGPDAAATSLLHAHWAALPAAVPPRAAVTFTAVPSPRWTFRGDDQDGRPFHLERTVELQHGRDGGEPALLVRWHNLGDLPLRLWVRPLLGWCDADHLPAADAGFDGTVQARGASWGVRPNGLLPWLWLTVDGVAAFRGEPVWYRGFRYTADQARGYDHIGDRWSPGVLELHLGPGQNAVAACSLREPLASPAAAWAAVAATAAVTAARWQTAADPLRARLAAAADDFLYRGPGGRLGVLAGFPWFGEWGRDVFLSLPGLTLARGRFDLCEQVLDGALPFLRGGLLPNIYGRTPADSHYGSCDAALWFTLAVQRYADAGGEPQRVRDRYLPALVAIAEAYLAGTELGMRVDAAGLLCAGRDDLNATWMDARTARGPVTPRQGQAVELQALWYALLDFLAAAGQAKWQAHRDRCGDAFLRGFWLRDGQYLADRLHDGRPDPTVRPNMVLAAALPRSPLQAAHRRGVVQKARAELLTPRGLRTLSPHDPAYRGRYQGGIDERDLAYHQGTVWPWLGGAFVEAALAASPAKDLPKLRRELRGWLDGFLPELERAHGHLSEVFDGDEPQRPGGTFAQAWNTGELLRALTLMDTAAPTRRRSRP